MTLDPRAFELIANSLKEPVMFVDMEHVVRYMNPAAVEHYKTGIAAIGQSIFDLHGEQSRKGIRVVLEAFDQGEDERRISDDDEPTRVYMRAVRDESGVLVGYYERYERPIEA